MKTHKLKYKFQRLIGGEYKGEKSFDTVSELVTYVNNYNGYDLNYGRVLYHLRRYGQYFFDRKCGEWQVKLSELKQ